MVGFWATLSLNIPDFSRYAKSQRDQIIGQAIGLPPRWRSFAFIGVAVTSATLHIFGSPIWYPLELVQQFKNPWALGLSMGAIVIGHPRDQHRRQRRQPRQRHRAPRATVHRVFAWAD